MKVKIEDIIANPDNRKFQGKPKVLESVGKEGIIIPLLVVKNKDGKYDLIDGHNRLFSAFHYGLTEVPVTVITQKQSETFGEVCNIDRQPLTELDEIIAINKLKNGGYLTTEIAGLLGMPRAKVGRRVKMLSSLSDEALSRLKKKSLSVSEAEALVLITKEQQDQVIKGGYFSLETIRREFLGISLVGIADVFKKDCEGCKYNTATDKDLFGEEETTCKKPTCLIEKIKAYMKQEGIEGLVGWQPATSPLAELPWVSRDYASEHYDTPHPQYLEQKKYMYLQGQIVYMGGIRKETKSAVDRKEEAVKESVNILNEALQNLFDYVYDRHRSGLQEDYPEEFGTGLLRNTLNLAAYRDLADRIIPSPCKKILAKGITTPDSLTYFRDYFRIKNPSYAVPSASWRKEGFAKAVFYLVFEYAVIKDLETFEDTKTGFTLSSFVVPLSAWNRKDSLDGKLMNHIRTFVDKYSKKYKVDVPEELMKNAATAYAESCRLEHLDEKDFEEDLNG